MPYPTASHIHATWAESLNDLVTGLPLDKADTIMTALADHGMKCIMGDLEANLASQDSQDRAVGLSTLHAIQSGYAPFMALHWGPAPEDQWVCLVEALGGVQLKGKRSTLRLSAVSKLPEFHARIAAHSEIDPLPRFRTRLHTILSRYAETVAAHLADQPIGRLPDLCGMQLVYLGPCYDYAVP